MSEIWIRASEYACRYGILRNTLYARYYFAKQRNDKRALSYFEKRGRGLFIREGYARFFKDGKRPKNADILQRLYFKHIDDVGGDTALTNAAMGFIPYYRGGEKRKSVSEEQARLNRVWATRFEEFRRFYFFNQNRNRELIARILINVEKVSLMPYFGSMIFNQNRKFG